ncbi:hypothetical protein CK485_23685 [Streptomyces sp. ICBB 8177]|nr:hypothetical protein CK485_23685 [Streptomyces sp. ICBB 8177]
MVPATPTGPRFTPREPPPDAAAYVARGVTSAVYRHRAVVTLHAPAERVAEYTTQGTATVEAVDDTRCVLRTGFASLDALAVYIALFGVEFEIHEPPELAARMREVGERLLRAAPEGPDATTT